MAISGVTKQALAQALKSHGVANEVADAIDAATNELGSDITCDSLTTGATICTTLNASGIISAASQIVASGQIIATAGIVMTGETSYLQLPSLTTTEQNALTPAAGMVIYNETLGKLTVYTGAAWETVTSA